MKSKRRTYPGSIYADRGKLIVKLNGEKHYTGLLDNKLGRARAEDILIHIYNQQHGLNSEIVKIPDLKSAFDEFIDSLVNRLPKTLTGYGSSFDAIVKKNKSLPVSEDNIRTIVIKYLKETLHSKVTQHTYINEFQVFLNFCFKKKWLPKINLKEDYRVRKPATVSLIWEDDEINLLLSYFSHSEPLYELSVLIRFMLLTGSRVVDCLTLDWSQIGNGMIDFKNKITKKSEPRPLSEKALSCLKTIGRGETGKVFRWKHGSSSRIHRYLREACQVLSIERNGRAFQEFRRTFRDRLLLSGCPPEYAQFLMRHADKEITDKIYTYYGKERISAELEKI